MLSESQSHDWHNQWFLIVSQNHFESQSMRLSLILIENQKRLGIQIRNQYLILIVNQKHFENH
jgi:hypothetical protein